MKIKNYYLPIRRESRVELERDFSEEEIFLALGRMKNNKAVGVDEVPIELLNYYETEEVGKQIRMIMNNALNSGNVESILKDVRIKVLFKKGDKKDMNNYRGISLISHGGKLLERLIQNRLYEYVEEIGFLPESQNGFRQNRSTIDSLFVSKMLTSNAIAKKKN